MFSGTLIADTYFEKARAKGSYRGMRRWRVCRVQTFPDCSASSIGLACGLGCGLSTITVKGVELHYSLMSVEGIDLTKSAAKKLLNAT